MESWSNIVKRKEETQYVEKKYVKPGWVVIKNVNGQIYYTSDYENYFSEIENTYSKEYVEGESMKFNDDTDRVFNDIYMRGKKRSDEHFELYNEYDIFSEEEERDKQHEKYEEELIMKQLEDEENMSDDDSFKDDDEYSENEYE
jgi:hypothetical protein